MHLSEKFPDWSTVAEVPLLWCSWTSTTYSICSATIIASWIKETMKLKQLGFVSDLVSSTVSCPFAKQLHNTFMFKNHERKPAGEFMHLTDIKLLDSQPVPTLYIISF